MKATKSPLILSCMIMVGCALVTERYQPPTSGETAEITFHNSNLGTMQAFIFKDAKECRHRAGTAGIPGASQLTTVIPANNDLAIWVVRTDGVVGPGCSYLFDFKPQSRKKYNFWIYPDTSAGTCKYNMTDDTDKAAPVPIRSRVIAAPLDENSPFCQTASGEK